MIETLYHRDENGSYRIGVVVIGDAPTDAEIYPHACSCYYVRMRVRTIGGIAQTFHLAVPHVPPHSLFTTLDTITLELQHAAAILRQHHCYDTDAPIEILDFALVTLALPDDAGMIRVAPSVDGTRWPGVTWTLIDQTHKETEAMGFINSNNGAGENRIWLNARNGALWYTMPNEEEQHKCSGYIGIIRGIRLRQRVFNEKTYTVIDMLMQDDADGTNPDVIVSGTLFSPEGPPTVFGGMLAQRLAHEDLKSRKGQPVQLSVWASKTNDRMTCCTFRDPKTDTALGRISLKEFDPQAANDLIMKFVYEAIQHFGSFGRQAEPASPAGEAETEALPATRPATTNASSHEQSPFVEEDDGLPF